MVLPGFATDDQATAFLRRFLERLGYDVHPWRLGWNLDHRTAGQQGEHVAHQIDKIVAATGRKVSLIGWSLGGVIAREAARRDPDAVRQVITIASPFSGNPQANHAGSLYEWLSGNKIGSAAALQRFALGSTPLPMPSTSIYSRSDGITAWENCVAQADHQTENVEVISSHFGMMLNTVVFQIVADRLAQRDGAWMPFTPQKASL
jgi:pimeloyl-ACP methyl ester carboxylesterase